MGCTQAGSSGGDRIATMPIKASKANVTQAAKVNKKQKRSEIAQESGKLISMDPNDDGQHEVIDRINGKSFSKPLMQRADMASSIEIEQEKVHGSAPDRFRQ